MVFSLGSNVWPYVTFPVENWTLKVVEFSTKVYPNIPSVKNFK